MSNEANAPHIEDIARVLGEKVDRDVIARELDEYLNVYRVPLGTAKESIVKKHGGNPQALSASVFRKLADLRPDEPSVDLLVRVVSANPKTIEVDGKEKDIVYGILGDDTGTLQFTAWDATRFPHDRGEVLRIVSAYTKGWNDEVQVNIGDRAAVSREEADALPPPPSGAASVSGGEVKVRDLRAGMRGLDLRFRVLSIEERKVMVKGEEKTVWSGTLADETGKTEFSSWHDFGLEPGDVVRLRGGYIRAWRGVPQLSFDGRDDVNALAREANGGRGFDHVIVSTAALPAIRQGLQCVEDGGTLLLFAPTRPGIELPLDLNDLWSRQVTLTTTYAASPGDLAEALELIRDRKVKAGEMVTHRLGLDETGEGFRLVAEAGKSLKVVVEPHK